MEESGTRDIVRLAVFDFDGTCIDGQTGLLFSQYLRKRGYVSAVNALKLVWWGARYVFHLPHRQNAPREYIFEGLSRYSVAEVQKIMLNFHNDEIIPRYRPKALAEVKARKADGCVTLLVSATFEGIARPAAAYLGVDGYVATQMEKDSQGHYTGRVAGTVTEGTEKPRVVEKWANERYGKGGWIVDYAYGDHHTDQSLLSLAKHPVAVSPGRTLANIAKRRGWTIVDWSLGSKG